MIALQNTSADSIAGFFILPSGVALPPPSATTILRIQMRKGDLRQYGIDVPPPVADDPVRSRLPSR